MPWWYGLVAALTVAAKLATFINAVQNDRDYLGSLRDLVLLVIAIFLTIVFGVRRRRRQAMFAVERAQRIIAQYRVSRRDPFICKL